MRGIGKILASLAPLSVLAVAGLLAACAANRNLVVVVPETDGHVGAVVVHAGSSAAVLDHAYAAAAPTATAAHPLKPGAEDAAKVSAIFGDALAALPVPPASYVLYFETDSVALTPQQIAELQGFLQTIRTRKAVEIVVTGHTDTVGSDDHNDELSLHRAEAIRLALLPILQPYGVGPDQVIAAGRGKRDLLVPTPDQTPEPRNRRVEVTVR
jgi:outer membrane protein OmpA-like peptidoglycan-associated protein